MEKIEYANAYSEVLEILKYISIEDYNKIPKEQIEFFEKNSNKNHDFFYNPYKTLDEQNVSKIAKGIIAIIFRDYWANETQREKIIAKERYDREQLEKEKDKEYNTNEILGRINTQNTKEVSEPQALIEQKETFFNKIINKIKKFFGK